MRHASLCAVAGVLSCAVLPEPLRAQPAPEPRSLCWDAAPKAACSVIVLTNFGVYAFGGSRERVTGFDPATGQPTGVSRPIRVGGRATGDWGLLLNVGQRDAVGASLFGSVEKTTGYGEQAELGAFLRYRRWFGAQRSLDLAVGMPVILRNGDALRSPYGLVKLNLGPRWGVALRPELRRSYSFSTAPPGKRSTLYLSAGVELGEWPGFALSSLGGAILGILTLIALGNSD
jgi:hypothetical protein